MDGPGDRQWSSVEERGGGPLSVIKMGIDGGHSTAHWCGPTHRFGGRDMDVAEFFSTYLDQMDRVMLYDERR